MFIQEMLRIDPSQIWSMLDEKNIRQDDSYNGSRSNPLPLPGRFIPVEDHHLLNEEFEKIAPGEYVGYEMEDPSMQQKEGDATFIYAVILEEVNAQENTSLLSKYYMVNVGNDKDPQEVEFADLYKFHRLQSSPLGLSDGLEKGYTKDKEMIFKQTSEILMEAWQLPEERRRKIVKRLFLRWHPDKNPGEKSLCDEVLQHIRKEIAKLERVQGDVIDDQSCYEPYFDFWKIRAKRQHTHRERYRKTYRQIYTSCDEALGGDSSSGIPPSFCTKNPQPGEARRWLRQAEADLVAVSNDVSTGNPSYEWACFKCHQVKRFIFIYLLLLS